MELDDLGKWTDFSEMQTNHQTQEETEDLTHPEQWENWVYKFTTSLKEKLRPR